MLSVIGMPHILRGHLKPAAIHDQFKTGHTLDGSKAN